MLWVDVGAFIPDTIKLQLKQQEKSWTGNGHSVLLQKA